MLQTLFFIPAKLGGIPLFGFGLLLAVWAAFCLCYFAWLVRRHGFSAETWSYVPIFLLVAAVIAFLLPAIGKGDLGLPIRGFGVMVLLGVLSGAGLAGYRAGKVGVSPDLIYSAIFWMVAGGILGARIFYVAQYWTKDYWPIYELHGLAPLLWATVNVSGGGLVVYGGFLGGMIGLFLFIRKYRVPLLPLMDLLAPSMMLGLAFGRIGCLLNGCCFGGVCDHGPAIYFPASYPADKTQITEPLNNSLILTPAYESQIELGQFYGFAVSSNENSEPKIVQVEKGSKADDAGLKAGQSIKKLDGDEVQYAGQVHERLRTLFYEQRPLRIVTDDGRSITLPALDPLPSRSLPVHPAQIYSSIDAFLILLLLMAYAPFRRRDGELFALMATIYPVSRFLMEILRNDEALLRGLGMTISQTISLLILLGTACLWYYISRQPKGFAFGIKNE
jgi:phosphatidylglycerol---prolipoprotein diacylglyceryl transferase